MQGRGKGVSILVARASCGSVVPAQGVGVCGSETGVGSYRHWQSGASHGVKGRVWQCVASRGTHVPVAVTAPAAGCGVGHISEGASRGGLSPPAVGTVPWVGGRVPRGSRVQLRSGEGHGGARARGEGDQLGGRARG